MRTMFFLFIGLVFSVSVFAAEEKVELTVYNQNFALVKDQRYFDLKKGLNTIRFTDVAALIEPTSVHFVSLTAANSCSILEQNYEYDLMNSDKLLSKYIDKNIKIVTQDQRQLEGVLLSFDTNSLVIGSADGLHMVARPKNITQILFEKTPEGLITRPTLVWEIENSKDGRHLTEVSYLTQGINWYCEYVVVLDKTDKSIDLDGWVSIDNRSGASYKNAGLKLIAGEVKRAPERQTDQVFYAMAEKSGRGAPQFDEKSFFEYHIYSLARKTSLKDNQTKQISLLNASGISINKELIFDPSKGKMSYRYYSDEETIKENTRVELEFINSQANKLGIPLPQGKIKVYKKDDDGALQFVGEDAIEHTPRDEKIRLYIGDAFDVVGERTRKNFKTEFRTMTETYEIVLRNHKDADVTIKVVEKMWRYANWEILDATKKGDKTDASTMQFVVKIPKRGEEKITYTVRYSW